MPSFDSLEEMVLATAEAVQPPERLSVSQAAEEYRYINNPGSYVGPYKNDKTPYLIEPQDVLTSLEYRGMVFVGPAQCGKTDMALNWLTYSVVCDPADLMHIDKAQSEARDWYHRRLTKLYRDAPEVGRRLVKGQEGQNTYGSKFTSGMLYSNTWPSKNTLSGKPIGRLWLADYDRFPDDIDGEGSAYDLAFQRMKSFRRFGMCAAESSPSKPIDNPKWVQKTPHQAPPTTGILELYNRGDRRRWMWRCVSCNGAFEPDFDLMRWNEAENVLAMAESAYLACPHCGQIYHENPQDGVPGKHGMNARGFWLRDGESWNADTSKIEGDPARSRIASFWLKGPAATFADWPEMVEKYLNAMDLFERTGQEEPLQSTINTDQGKPYLPMGLQNERSPEELKARANEQDEIGVPDGCRFLIATVDVQPRRFEVQVTGFGERDVYIVDRFKIRKSERRDDDGDPLPLNTANYVEDWNVLIDQVMFRTYPLLDGSGRKMQIRMSFCDSGGKEGTTRTAYEFWRHLKLRDGRNLHRNFYLLKGEPRPSAALVRVEYPDAERKDRKAGARGDVPVVFMSANKGKDMANVMLGREDPGNGYVHFPAHLEDWYYTELTAETRTPKGWVNTGKSQNESWDLLYYALCGAHLHRIAWPKLNWENPPGWAKAWGDNDLVSDGDNFRFEVQPKGDINLAKLAEKLA